VRPTPFSYLFSAELRERLQWFITLRWVAVTGLAAASVVGPVLGLESLWPSLLLVAVFVAVYNLVFAGFLRKQDGGAEPYANLRTWAIRQIVMDLAALVVSVHFTGGMQSPLLPFFAFHMAIGTIMIATPTMYLLASVASTGVLGLFVLDVKGVVPSWALEAAPGITNGMSLASVVVAMFGIVYLTDSVTSRFKQRNIELHHTSEQLRERSRELQGLLQEKEELERQKSHYMRISAHQLRSPLGTIKTSLTVLVDGYLDPASDRGKMLLAGAAERVDDLLEIVNDLLELAKMREGRAKAPWARQVFINQVLADIFDALDPLAKERQVNLVADIRGVAKLDWGVPPDLVYAFENLINNAIKYSDSGGEVTVRLRVEDEITEVSVTDRGIGIPENLVDDVFLEFVRAPNAKHHTKEGTGLGLSIVREAINMHGGTIILLSREGRGSSFTVRLPLHYTPPEVTQLLRETDNGAGTGTPPGRLVRRSEK